MSTKFEYKIQMKLTFFILCFIKILIQITNHLKLKNDKNFQQILNTKFNPNLPRVKKMKICIKNGKNFLTYYTM